ncbi:sulfite exporter TauE/SafE family protein [Brevundimonas sp. 3P9-tot-E]|uniref:Probable membrane transporter protein n=2 Tax=Brevundimonas TaxID=41275 RepID=A0A1R4ET83_BREDI|nr:MULTISPECIES: sulfite exporter TauE/SafE family protein [Brevundimonas]MDA0744042.1 sulfite exporter TauE/SafE family protein [Pseudomonadota bacterium]MBK1968611.1 sulfite exporter TauE/SafE family protein [Brevundimonas diminuta]MBK1975768.1 sulfite exporter TauE/SafE family protein [Brevundimonas diminuta]MDA1321979.1 sulfite exporter TauE/SafE family protein [Pseudomonadota bacterium]MDM8352239.1 sulfite exporter TauE/SafE family protein [Brevundimonas diminuta]
MDIYLPIAEVSVNWPLLVLLGALVGFVSGLFGIGGGFLMAPVLVFLGIPPTVAVASQASHVVASSTSGVIRYSGMKAVDYRIGGIMAVGGALGAVLGVELFRYLRLLGQADLVVALSYLLFLGSIGSMMLYESLTQILHRVRGETPPRKERRRPMWLYGLPFKMRFPRSGLYISAIPPFGLGVFAGILSAIMGVGGGFILVPAMLYVLRMKASVVVGTSLFQIIITTAITTVLQAGRNQTVDIVLSTILLLGGVVGAQYGAKLSGRFRAEEMRAALGLIVLLVGIQMGLELFVRPSDLFLLAPGVAD